MTKTIALTLAMAFKKMGRGSLSSGGKRLESGSNNTALRIRLVESIVGTNTKVVIDTVWRTRALDQGSELSEVKQLRCFIFGRELHVWSVALCMVCIHLSHNIETSGVLYRR